MDILLLRSLICIAYIVQGQSPRPKHDLAIVLRYPRNKQMAIWVSYANIGLNRVSIN